ncbi:MAG: hypothetical protein HYW78_04360 [Parcubacteria group bacterium]|nr:hypothetical protein [Parcubacteria group bacterium]
MKRIKFLVGCIIIILSLMTQSFAQSQSSSPKIFKDATIGYFIYPWEEKTKSIAIDVPDYDNPENGFVKTIGKITDNTFISFDHLSIDTKKSDIIDELLKNLFFERVVVYYEYFLSPNGGPAQLKILIINTIPLQEDQYKEQNKSLFKRLIIDKNGSLLKKVVIEKNKKDVQKK